MQALDVCISLIDPNERGWQNVEENSTQGQSPAATPTTAQSTSMDNSLECRELALKVQTLE